MKRVSVAGDYGITVEVTPQVSISDVFDFNSFRNSGNNQYLESSLYAPNLSSTQPTTPFYSATSGADNTSNFNFNPSKENIKSNTILAGWDPSQRFKFSLGYRYRDRNITVDSGGNVLIQL